MTVAQKTLQFNDVDAIAFSASRGKLRNSKDLGIYAPEKIGPLLELLQLHLGGRIPHPGNWLTKHGQLLVDDFLERTEERWVDPSVSNMRYLRLKRHMSTSCDRITDFWIKAQRAGEKISRLPPNVAGQLVAAMRELKNNIHEHADADETGILIYKAETNAFEFVVADRGVGILRSLQRSPDFAQLLDEGKALKMALTEGVSRHGIDIGRGMGFRPIFIGLANMRCKLRFRSGDHAITMNGVSSSDPSAQMAQKARIDGFFASVRCQP